MLGTESVLFDIILISTSFIVGVFLGLNLAKLKEAK